MAGSKRRRKENEGEKKKEDGKTPASKDSDPDTRIANSKKKLHRVANKDTELGGTELQNWTRKTLLVGTGEIAVTQMKDSTSDFKSGDFDTLRSRLAGDGYLLLRGVVPQDTVLESRKYILDKLGEAGFLKPGADPMAGFFFDKDLFPRLLNRQDIAHDKAVLQTLEHPAIEVLMTRLLQTPVKTSQYKWLRAVTQGKFTGVHVDRVYMGNGSSRLLTAWIPLGAIPAQQGTLVVSPGSHVSSHLHDLRTSYGRSTVGADGHQSGWYTTDPNDILSFGQTAWCSTDFQAGDVCVLGLDLLHASSTNCTDCYRLSCDTRWQPVDEAMDPRLDVQLSTHPASIQNKEQDGKLPNQTASLSSEQAGQQS